ncbi:Membrane carboxypeptidase (penicillin-binding protein) [Agromyces sp. CF514]|uniref:transglycosylase domain-containing protein n=1 Tax=Agromyces sp. CF514 TaxID=1881031 RepID=UPI0008EB9409|nr:transglycosylase domain-containing protein [Agromyces sp. CF514]SFR72427.1 Membrane carboxypeptidase (penicillin-binding protein) [Agromyces sp. CF514]
MSDVGSGILAFVGMSALAGVLVTAAVTPALAVTGMAANNSITMFENLPGFLDIGELSEKTDVYAMQDDGKTPYKLASFFEEDREEVAFDQISQYVKDAAVAGEDPRFYEHGGIDVQGTLRAALNEYVIGGATQGGSSITQQYVKNVLVNNAVNSATTEEEREAAVDAAIETTPERKLKEMRYAITIEKEYTKDQILRGYLNIAAFGGRVYGIESAAQYYFGGKHASELSLAESASLIAIVNWPEKFRLDEPDSETNGAKTVVDGQPVPYADNKVRRDYILDQMLKEKKITQEEHDAAVATVVAPVIQEPSTGCQTAGGSGFFCDYVTWVIKNQYDDPKTPDVNEGTRLLQTGGLQIYTTLDLSLQATAENAISQNVPSTDPRFDVGSAAVTVQPGTGRILAMAQNKQFTNDPELAASDGKYTAINYNTDFDYGGSSGLQPGSTFKVFTLAEWLNEGHSLKESFNGARRTFTSFPAACYGGWTGSFNPRNDDGTGANNAVDATKYSVNTSFMAMAQQLDLCKIRDTAQAFGVRRADGLDLGQKFEYDDNGPVYNEDGTRKVNPDEVFSPSAVLGTEEVSPLAMATAFAGIANNGLTCTPIAIDRITKADGTEVDPPKSTCTQSVTAEVAHAMDYAMEQTFNGGTTSASDPGTGIAHIGKTGTTDDAKDTWMIGASTKASTAVWVGNVTGDANLRELSFDSGYAATARHRIWPMIMSVADGKFGGDDFPDAPDSMFKEVLVDIPQVTGLTLDAAKQAIEAAGFVFADGGPQDSALPAGTVTGSNPTGQAGRGTTITVYTSNGTLKAVPNVVGQQADVAEAALKQAGYRVKRTNVDTTDASQVGLVVSQDPGADGSAKPGDTITIGIGKLDDSGGGGGTDGGGTPTLPGGGG